MRLLFTAMVFFLSTASTATPTRAQMWAQILPSMGETPPARALASAVFDSQERRMIVFGGQDVATTRNDVWAFDLDTHLWVDLTPASGPVPTARLTPVSVYDPVGHRMLMWSGQGAGGTFFNDVWQFDLTTNTWAAYSPTGAPPNIRYGAAGVFDPVTGELVTFAGFTNQGRFNDVWRFDGLAATWADVSPLTGPIKRCLHSASYDEAGHRYILFGGQSSGALGDSWALDLATDTWTELTPASGPTGRWFTAHVYDSDNHRATIFGGNTGTGETAEVWVLDLTTNVWHELNPVGTPPTSREGAVAVHDSALDRIVIFGGRAAGNPNNEVWAIERLSDTATGIDRAVTLGGPRIAAMYPNPFNPSIRIAFTVSKAAPVSLRVYDVAGRLVRTLVDEPRSAGRHSESWNGTSEAGSPVASGVYVVEIRSGGTQATRKAVLLK